MSEVIATPSPELQAPVQGVVDTPKAEPQSPVTPQPNQDAKRFAALAKRERMLFQRDRDLQGREARLAAVEEEIAQLKAIKTAARQNPMEALKYLGTDYKTITDYVLNNEKLPAEYQINQVKEELRGEVELLKKQREEDYKKAQERESQDYDRVKVEFIENCNDYARSNLDKYELINLNEAFNLIPAVIEQNFYKTQKESGKGRILSIDEACDLVERHLEGRVEANIKSKKWQAKATPQPKEEGKQPSPNTLSTLTNNMTSSSASVLSPQNEADRMKRAMAKLG